MKLLQIKLKSTLIIFVLFLSAFSWGQVSIAAHNTAYNTSFNGWNGTMPTGFSVSGSGAAYRGTSASTTGGTYAISNSGFGYQPSSSASAVTLTGTFKNTTGSAITKLEISYKAFMIVSRSSRTPNWTVTSSLGTGVSPLTWTFNSSNTVSSPATKTVTLSGLNIAANATFTLVFSSDRGSGSGSSPMIGLKDVSVKSLPSTVAPSLTGSSTSLSVTYGNAGSLAFTSSGTPTPTISLSAISPTTSVPTGMTADSNSLDVNNTVAAGTYNIRITASNSAGSATRDVTVTVNKASQVITFNPLTAVSYGDSPFSLTATGGSSGQPVTYTSSNTDVATVSGNTVTILTPGVTTITASQIGNNNYSNANNVQQTLVVNPKQLSVTGATATDKVYDGTDAATITDATLSGSIVGTDDVALDTYTAAFDNKNVGTGKPVAINYTLTGAQSDRYELAQPTGVTASITVKDLTVTGISIASKDFDGNTSATIVGTPALDGLIEGDDVTLDSSLASAEFDNIGPGGSVPVMVSGYSISGFDAGNYNFTQPAGLSANINDTGKQDQTITFNALNPVTYGDAPFQLNATSSSNLAVAYESSDESVATVSGNTVTIVAVGTVTITAIQGGDDIYNPAPATPQELIVAPKELTVAGAAVITKVYDGTTFAEVTGTLNGIVGSDDVTLSGTGTFTSEDAATGIIVTTEYSITGNDINNYYLTQPGDLTGNITPAELTVSGATALNKVYDATTDAVITGTLEGIIGTDDVSLIGTGIFDSANKGEAIPVTSTSTLGGNDSGNYTLTQPTGLSADITGIELTVNATAENKVYDGTTDAVVSGAVLSGDIIDGDDVSLTATTVAGTFENENAGLNKNVAASFTLTGDNADNYSIAAQTYQADITPLTITADASSASVSTKIYDGTTGATLTGVTLNDVIDGDTVEAVTGTYATANAGENIEVAIVLTGADAANYTLTQPEPALIGTINKATLTVTPDSNVSTANADVFSVNAGGEIPDFTIRYSGFVNGETTATATGFTQATATTTIANTNTAGAYPVTATGGSANNYELSYQGGWFIINETTDAVVPGANNIVIWSNDITASNPSALNPYTTGDAVSTTYITVSGIGRGSGIGANAGSGRYNANSWDSSSLDANAYFYFTITPKPGYKLNLVSFTYVSSKSGTGPGSYAFRSSKDNYAANIGSPAASGTTISLSGTPYQELDGSITFRFYGWGASSSSGTFSIDSFNFRGTVTQETAVPGTAPSVNSSLTDSSVFGATDTYQITATGSPVMTYSATNLPTGATIDDNGLISFDGTTPEGDYNISLTATNYYGTNTKTLVYTVNPTPSLSATPTAINSLQAYFGQNDTSTTATVDAINGANLLPASGNIIVTPSAGFVVSVNNGTYSSGAQTAGNYTGGTASIVPNIKVKLADGLTAGTHTGTLTFDGGGATAVIDLDGEVKSAPAIRTVANSYGPYCQGNSGDTITVAYTTEGDSFPEGNFFIQYSNASGVFSGISNTIFTSQGTSSPLTATLPSNLATGNYLVRVIHLSNDSQPVVTASTDDIGGDGADNGSFIVVNALPTLSGVSAPAACNGSDAAINLSGLLANATVDVDYTVNAGAVQTTSVTADASGNGSFNIAVLSENNGQQIAITGLTRTDVTPNCTTTVSSNNSATLSVNPAPAVTGISSTEICPGEDSLSVQLTGLTAANNTVTYMLNNGVDGPYTATVASIDGEGMFYVEELEEAEAGTTTNLEIISITDNATGCSSEINLTPVNLIIYNRPTVAATTNNAIVCLGNNTNVNLTLTGVAPWHIEYTVTYTDTEGNTGTPQPMSLDYIMNNAYVISTSTTQAGTYSYAITNVTDSNGCTATDTLNSAVVFTVNSNIWTGSENSEWNNANNWSCGEVPTNIIPATIMAGGNQPIISGTAYAASLLVENGAEINVPSGNTLQVTNAINVQEGAFVTIANNANLVQVNNVANSGNITVLKNGSELFREDYTFWSAPVQGQLLRQFSPQTLATRFYTYDTNNNTYAAVGGLNDSSETTFEVGKGYLIRMPNTNTDIEGYDAGSTAYSYEGVFNGVPNNGDINITLLTGSSRYNGVGNPYPSPISVEDFFAANTPTVENGMTGGLDPASAIYFWRKKNNSSASSYAYLTRDAYVFNSASGGNTGDEEYGGAQWDDLFNVDNTPSDWVINPGQGFIVRAASGTSYPLVFNNSMRRGDVHNNQFFRSAAPQPSETVSRYWLNMKSSTGGFSQSAIVYSSTATLGLDYGRDGRILSSGGEITLYSKANDAKLAIQARPEFDESDVVPMEYKVTTTGIYTISLHRFDGLFENQDIFLKDNIAGITHNLKDSAYSFTSDSGTFEDRFEVVYVNEALGIDNPVIDANSIIVYKQDNSLKIDSGKYEMTDVTVFDIRGRMLYNAANINANETTITNLQKQEQMLIVQITTANNGKVSKKVVF